MERLNLKPTHKAVRNYYEALRQFKTIGVSHEGAVRSAFQTLLEHCGRQFGWKLVPEWAIRKNGGFSICVDGAPVGEYRPPPGFLGGKNTPDHLAEGGKKEKTPGYPPQNNIFLTADRPLPMR